MKISVDKLLENCPEKLLEIYPAICERIKLFQETNDKSNLEPFCVLVWGSRASGKSEFFSRAGITAITDGYANAVKYATITDAGLTGCKDAIERLYPQCVGTGKNSAGFEPMHRCIRNGRIDFDFFGKQDVKTEQHKYDILICEEVEKWGDKGVAALETEIRHCSVIILISNNPPLPVLEFCKSHRFKIININYWDNKVLPRHIFEAYERAKLESPSYYYRFVMCSDETPNPRWFDTSLINNFFLTDIPPNLEEVNYTCNGIDVGAGTGGDESVICTVRQTRNKHIFVDIYGKFQLESMGLAAEVAKARAATRSDEEIWDAQGIGLAVMQTRAPNHAQRQALGVIGFQEDGSQTDDFFNCRSEAYGIWHDMLASNMCHFYGDKIYIDEIRQEMNAQMYYDSRENKATFGKRRLAPKAVIKKFMTGHSPNMCDAIAIAIWRTVKRPVIKSMYQTMGYKISGAPGL